MLDHMSVSVSDIERSIRFYDAALTPLGITARLDYDGKDGPRVTPISKDLVLMAECFSGCARALWRGELCTLDSWRAAKPRLTLPTPPPWRMVLATTVPWCASALRPELLRRQRP